MTADVLTKFTDPLRWHVETILAERSEEPLTPRQVANEAMERFRRTCPEVLQENLVKYALDGSVVGLARRLLKAKVRLPGFTEPVPMRLLIDGRYKPLVARSGRLLLTADEIRANANRKLRLTSLDRRSAQVLIRLADWMDGAAQKTVGAS